jgi:L-fucose dehydrogenase
MNLGLQDKVIVVTGGARGIGGAISKVLATEGAIPVIIGHDVADNEAAVDAITEAGGLAHAILTELTHTEDCLAAIDTAIARFGRIDGLVNNAGVNDRVGLETGDTERFLLSLRRNLVHYFDMTRFALPELKRSRGSIVNISSKVAECWTPMYELWAASFPDPVEARRRIEARIPLGQRMTTPEEIADAVAFLLSPRSGHTTGQLLHVDGGYVHLDRAAT